MASEVPQGKHDLKLGKSFDKKSGEVYHTVRYDFKPASLEECKECYIDFGQKCETVVSIPRVDSSDEVKDLTLFKGSRKPTQKECLLIYDHETGEFILEDLAQCIQVKQVRCGEEEREKNLQYMRNIRNKYKPQMPFDHASRVASEAAHQAQNTTDLLMSDDDDESSDSSSSSSDEESNENVKNSQKKEKGSDEDASNMESGSEEDDIAKTLEAVVATETALRKTSPNLPTMNLDQSAATSSATPTDYTLHDDLHLSDSSDDDDG